MGYSKGRKLLVSVETPCKGHPPAFVPAVLQPIVERLIRRVWNRRYTALCMRDSMSRGEAPFASQALYDQPGILNDADPDERALGMHCGLAWSRQAELFAVYADHGITDGMKAAVRAARASGTPVQFRYVLSPQGHHLDEAEASGEGLDA